MPVKLNIQCIARKVAQGNNAIETKNFNCLSFFSISLLLNQYNYRSAVLLKIRNVFLV